MEWKGYMFFLVLVLLSGSCDTPSDNDQSFDVEEYKKIGMPAPDSIWSFKDYVETCKILANLKTFRPLSLPKKDSKKSSVYFNRIIDPENISFIFDESIPLSIRAERIQAYIDIQGSLITTYTDTDFQKQNYNQELIDLYIFGLTIAQNMLDLGQRINESVDDKEIEMQYAYGSIQHMYLKMVLFVLDNQSKTNLFKETDLEKLSEYLSDSIMLNIDWMDEPSREDIEKHLQKVMDNTSSVKIIDKYQTLLEII